MLEKMNQGWQNALKRNDLQEEMEFMSYSSTQKKQIQSSLLFWEFVKRQFRVSSYDDLFTVSDSDRKAFLMQYVDAKNPYLALVAKIEMLPTRVWRKLLWRYNVDFLSLESFLRRIFFKENAYQREAIFSAWDDIYQKKTIPAVLDMRIWDRFMMTIYVVMKFLGMEQFIPNFTSFNGEVRYRSKGAWSYNLAHLDFGFSKYIHSTQSDEQDTSILTWGMKTRKFFSFKNHVNDFSTNDEDGVYWFFYRFVRNWGFILPLKIKLTGWVCPGFWTTLIGFFGFLTLPLVSLLFMPLIGSWTLLIALPVIIWAGVWFSKIIFGSLYFGIKKRSKVLSRIFLILAVPLISFGIVWLLSKLWLLFVLVYTLLQSLPVGFMIAILLLIVAEVGLLILRIPKIDTFIQDAKNIKKTSLLRYNSWGLVVSIITTLVYVFFSQISPVVQATFDAIVDFFSNYWIESLVLLLMVLIVIGFVKLSQKEYEEKVMRKFDFILLSLSGILLVGILYLFIKIAFISISYILIPLLVVFLAVVLVYTFYILSLKADKILDKKRDKVIYTFAEKHSLSYAVLAKYLRYYLLAVNPSVEVLGTLLDKLWEFSQKVCSHTDLNVVKVFQYLFFNLSLVDLDIKKLNNDTINIIENKSYSRSFYIWELIWFVSGSNFDQISKLREEKEKLEEEKDTIESEKRYKRQEFWSRLFSPFTYVFGKMGDFFQWFVDLLSGLQILVDIFHHYCPRNQERKNL